MGSTLSREDLGRLLDQVTREITQREAGIILNQTGSIPGGAEGEACTVYTSFNRGIDASLSLRADMSLFVRLACGMMQTEELSPQDVEEVAKEYFNVLCGHVLSRLFQLTRLPARFNVPSFCRGRHVVEGTEEDIVLNYVGDRHERAQLIHHRPCGAETAVV